MDKLKKAADRLSLDNERLAQRLVMKCLQKQNNIAAFLSRNFEKLSPGKKKIILAIYIIVFASISIFILVKALKF